MIFLVAAACALGMPGPGLAAPAATPPDVETAIRPLPIHRRDAGTYITGTVCCVRLNEEHIMCKRTQGLRPVFSPARYTPLSGVLRKGHGPPNPGPRARRSSSFVRMEPRVRSGRVHQPASAHVSFGAPVSVCVCVCVRAVCVCVCVCGGQRNLPNCVRPGCDLQVSCFSSAASCCMTIAHLALSRHCSSLFT